MSHGLTRTVRQRVFGLLVDAGKWVKRTDLAKASGVKAAVEDALADLVLEDKVEYSPAMGYRLSGGEQVREAARALRASHRKGSDCAPVNRAVSLSAPNDQGERVMGVAELRALSPEVVGGVTLEMVTYRMVLPGPKDVSLAGEVAFANQFFEQMRSGDGRDGLPN